MEIKCKNGCEDPGWFYLIEATHAAIKPDGSFIDKHLIDLDLNNEALEEILQCSKCSGAVSVTGD